MLFLKLLYETTYMKIVLYYTYLQYGDPAPIILLSLSCRQVNTEPDKTGEYHENLIASARRKALTVGLAAATLAASFGAASAQQLYPAPADQVYGGSVTQTRKLLLRAGIAPISIVLERAAAKVWAPIQCARKVLATYRIDQFIDLISDFRGRSRT